MADAAIRREARRRKILENSKSRLKLITGEAKELINNEISTISNNFDENKTTKTNEFNAIQFAEICQHNNEYIDFQSVSADQLEKTSTLAVNNPSLQENEIATNKSAISLYSRNLIIIALASLIRFLFIFQMQYCVKDSIFLPFIIAEITLQLLNYDVVDSKIAFLNTILLLSNLSPRFVKILTQTLNFLINFTRDLSIYFFTFLVLHICLESIF